MRIEDFKAYIIKAASGQATMGAGLFAQMASAQDNQRNLESILYDKIIAPIASGEVIDVTVGTPIPFSQSGMSGDSIRGWNPASTLVLPIRMSLNRNFAANLGKTLDSVSSGYQRTPFADPLQQCSTVLRPFDGQTDVGLSIMPDVSGLQPGFLAPGITGIVSSYRLMGVRVREGRGERESMKLDIQIVDASGTVISESITGGDSNDRSARVFSRLNNSPWTLVRQNRSCFNIAMRSDFKVALQVDENTLKNAEKVIISLHR